MINIYCYFPHFHFSFLLFLIKKSDITHCSNPNRRGRSFFFYILWLEKPTIAIFRQKDPKDYLQREFMSCAFSHEVRAPELCSQLSWAAGSRAASGARPGHAHQAWASCGWAEGGKTLPWALLLQDWANMMVVKDRANSFPAATQGGPRLSRTQLNCSTYLLLHGFKWKETSIAVVGHDVQTTEGLCLVCHSNEWKKKSP